MHFVGTGVHDCPFSRRPQAPVRQKTAPTKVSAVIFEKIRQNQLSLGVLRVPFDIVNIVRYREHREYANIKCCTKFAPKSHHIKCPFSSTNWNLSELFQTINLLVVQFCHPVLIVISHFTIELHGCN